MQLWLHVWGDAHCVQRVPFFFIVSCEFFSFFSSCGVPFWFPFVVVVVGLLMVSMRSRREGGRYIVFFCRTRVSEFRRSVIIWYAPFFIVFLSQIKFVFRLDLVPLSLCSFALLVRQVFICVRLLFSTSFRLFLLV